MSEKKNYRERYKRIGNSEEFKKHYCGKCIGEEDMNENCLTTMENVWKDSKDEQPDGKRLVITWDGEIGTVEKYVKVTAPRWAYFDEVATLTGLEPFTRDEEMEMCAQKYLKKCVVGPEETVKSIHCGYLDGWMEADRTMREKIRKFLTQYKGSSPWVRVDDDVIKLFEKILFNRVCDV